MPRILFITYSHNVWGGIEKWLHDLTFWLQNRQWDLHVGLAKGARFNSPDAYLAAHGHMRKHAVVIDGSIGTDEARIDAIVRTCRSLAPDIVVPVGIGAVFPAIERLRSQDGKSPRLVVPVHSTHADYLQNILEYFPIVDQVVVISRQLEKFLEAKLPGEEHRIHYVKNRAAEPVTERVPPGDKLRIAYVGRLDTLQKRVQDIVPFCRKLHDAGAAAEIHVYGAGPAEAALKEQLREYIERGDVVFHGYMSPEMLYREAYPKTDVLIMFSDAEGSPFVLPEAMHHGIVPVISRFSGHASEGLLVPGRNSLTFPVGCPDVAAGLVLDLLNDPDLRAALGRQALKDVESDIEEGMFQDWETLLLRAMDEPPRQILVSACRPDAPSPPGRLEKLGLSHGMANWLRGRFGRKFPHGSGFDEWPGSLPASETVLAEICALLDDIERDAGQRLYSKVQ